MKRYYSTNGLVCEVRDEDEIKEQPVLEDEICKGISEKCFGCRWLESSQELYYTTGCHHRCKNNSYNRHFQP